MAQLPRWIAVLLILCAPAVALAQGAGGGTERFLFGQRMILGMLVALITITLIFGVFTIAHVFRGRRGRGGVSASTGSGDGETRQHPGDRAA